MIYNPITTIGFLGNVYLFALIILRGKHCQHPNIAMGVVEHVGQGCTESRQCQVFNEFINEDPHQYDGSVRVLEVYVINA